MLDILKVDRILFIAIPLAIYTAYFNRNFYREALEKGKLKIIVFSSRKK